MFMFKYRVCNLISALVAVVLVITAYRFPKYHRQNDTLIYKVLGTTMANIWADTFVMKMDIKSGYFKPMLFNPIK